MRLFFANIRTVKEKSVLYSENSNEQVCFMSQNKLNKKYVYCEKIKLKLIGTEYLTL